MNLSRLKSALSFRRTRSQRTEDPFVSRAGGQRGFFLPLLFVVLSIVMIFAFQRMFVSRQGLLVTTRLAWQEVLYQVCQSSISIAKAKLLSFTDALALGTVNPDANPMYRKFHDALVNSDGFPDLRAIEIPFDSDLFDELTGSIGAGMDLDVKVCITDVNPLHDPSLFPETAGEKYERSFTVRIVAAAEIDGFEVSAVSFTQGRVVLGHVPPFSKFTLFVRDRDGFDPNSIFDSEKQYSVTNHPVIVKNGASISGSDVLKPTEMRDFIDGQGFVFLGGAQWNLNHSSIGENPGLSDAGLSKDLFLFKIQSGPLASNPLVRLYSTCKGMFKESKYQDSVGYMQKSSREESSASSVLNLFGTMDRPSPTMVLGDARRRYILEQGIFNTATGERAPLPYLTSSIDFNAETWPGQISRQHASVIRNDIFGSDMQAYSPRMSMPANEDFNLGIGTYVEPSNPQDRLVFKTYDPGIPALKSIMVNNGAAIPHNHNFAGYLTIRDGDGTTLFDGDPNAFDVDAFLARKVCFNHKSLETFRKYRKSEIGLMLKGVEKIAGVADISSPLVFRQGTRGILVVEKDVRVGARISAQDGTLYIVSQKGDIHVETSQRVDAYLMALNGTVVLPEKFEINGGIAVKGFRSGCFKESMREKTISYDQNLDLTRRDVRKKGFTIVTREEWDFYVP